MEKRGTANTRTKCFLFAAMIESAVGSVRNVSKGQTEQRHGGGAGVRTRLDEGCIRNQV